MFAGILIISIVILLFFSLGVIFSQGKGAFLIAGYNTMPLEDREKYDTVALCKFMGKLIFALCFSMIFWLLSIVFDKQFLFFIGLGLFMIFLLFGLIYMNAGNRFKKKE